MGENINWLDQSLGMVRIPGHFSLTSGGNGAGFPADFAIIFGREMGDQSMTYHQCIGSNLYRQKVDQSIEARLQPFPFAMSPFSYLRDRLFIFRQVSNSNRTLSTNWRNFSIAMLSR